MTFLHLQAIADYLSVHAATVDVTWAESKTRSQSSDYHYTSTFLWTSKAKTLINCSNYTITVNFTHQDLSDFDLLVPPSATSSDLSLLITVSPSTSWFCRRDFSSYNEWIHDVSNSGVAVFQAASARRGRQVGQANTNKWWRTLSWRSLSLYFSSSLSAASFSDVISLNSSSASSQHFW